MPRPSLQSSPPFPLDERVESNGHEPVTRPASLQHSTRAIQIETASPRLLPVPMNQHTGWEASNVPTAKCDLCQKQSRGVIQKCSQCKLSVCKTCAHDHRLQDDPRHALDPDAVDWKPPSSSAVRKTRPSPQKGRIRKRKSVTTAPGRRQLRERDRVPSKARFRPPPPSRKTSVPFNNVAGHETHSESPLTEAGRRHEDKLDASAAETAEIAAILAGMQRQPSSVNDGLHLPPVRSVNDTLQHDHLPSLRTLHPSLGVRKILETDGFSLPRPAVMVYGNLHRTSDVRHEAATHDDGGNQPDENAAWNHQQSDTFYHYPPIASDFGLANMTFSVSSATQGPVWQSHTVSRTPLPSRRPQHQGQQAAELSQTDQSTTASSSSSNAEGPLTTWENSASSRVA
ncbi:hypothetical protein L249_7348 [Ophiocordyceps polyrhachis-furcata BCC 54312]|uniref:Uncharacterized protein n=1 Tax=Ophiocordyceps polyrhachis-furcata BCC 54312 TaxID=1330021 RepID=A0A367LAW8_9HYPO|nr:hypothetical protein L249_7348 [Ophiocordyceps polyrhachis-furcata BCC 54312]